MKDKGHLKIIMASLLLTVGGICTLGDIVTGAGAVKATFNDAAARQAYVEQLDQGRGGTLEQQQDMAKYANAERRLKNLPLDLGLDGVMLLGSIALAAKGIKANIG